MTIKKASLIGLARSAVVALLAVLALAAAVWAGRESLLELLPPPEFDLEGAAEAYPLTTYWLIPPEEGPSQEDLWAEFQEIFTDKLEDTDLNAVREGLQRQEGQRYDPVSLQYFLYNNKLVWQGRYRFSVAPELVFDTGVYLEQTTYIDQFAEETAKTRRYVLVSYRDALMLTAVPYGQAFTRGMALTGVFTHIDADLLEALHQTVNEETPLHNLFPLMLDTTQDFSSMQAGDLAMIALLAVLAVLLLVRLVGQIARPGRRPVYKKLALLGGNEAELDSQLAQTTPQKGLYRIKTGWILKTGPIITGLTRG